MACRRKIAFELGKSANMKHLASLGAGDGAGAELKREGEGERERKPEPEPEPEPSFRHCSSGVRKSNNAIRLIIAARYCCNCGPWTSYVQLLPPLRDGHTKCIN